MGDSSDNIPGVPKVGPKTAVKWINEYGSLDAVMKNADEIGGKVGENLRSSLEQLPLSRTLTTIKYDVPLPVDLHSLTPSEPDNTALAAYFTELEFKAWREELQAGSAAEEASPSVAPTRTRWPTR